MQIEKANINDLISPDWNPRQITEEELKKLETSLNEFGYIEPIIVNDVNNHIVGGNQRCKALKQLGYEEVDVVYVHIEDIHKEKACNVALNKISGDWDNDKLKVVLEEIELSPIDVSLTGFDEIELTEMEITTEEPTEVVEDDYTEPNDLEVKVQQGDIYILGNHRLMCGDSTKEEDVNLLMDGNKADLVFTDPPYGNGKSGRYGRGQLGIRTIQGDKDLSVFNNFIKIIPCDKIIYFLQWRTLCESLHTISQANLKLNTIGVWDKRQPGLNASGGIAEEWEAIIFAGNITYTKFGGNVFNISRINTKRENMPHPHQKPLQLLNQILSFIDNVNTILDPFAGSGSILMLCEELNKQCYSMELSQEYCQVIINRWEEYTGQKAEKIN